MGFICSSKEKEGSRGGKASLNKILRLGNHPNFFQHFVWVSSNPNLYNCDFNCFSSVCVCFEVVLVGCGLQLRNVYIKEMLGF